jgi:NAD(P) transhydrogenase
VKVTLVESRPRLLEFVDEEIGESLQFRLRDMGVRLRLGESVATIELVDDAVEAELGSKKRIRAEALLYTIGEQQNSSLAILRLPGVKKIIGSAQSMNVVGIGGRNGF